MAKVCVEAPHFEVDYLIYEVQNLHFVLESLVLGPNISPQQQPDRLFQHLL